ncbi:hypothetical protein [Winogradskyella sp. Asnod2-B02-A]|uniref:hypothetical protein n=1 Tax=Winogradskyella sp. Asnod2-B02-A TaxID=3160583 RepID=UPI003868FF9D
MKTKYLFLLLITVLLSSCEDIETSDLGLNSDWLQFENSSDNMSEGEASMQVPILYSSNENTDGVDVSFTYTATVPNGFTVLPANGMINIPAGEFVGYITVIPEDDAVASDDIIITFSIEGNTAAPLGIAGQGIYNVTTDFRIIEDDCPIEISDFVGTYNVDEIFTGDPDDDATPNAGFGLGDFFGESYQMEAVLDPSDTTGTKLIFTNSPGFNTYFNDGVVVTFITCTKEVIIDDGSPLIAEWNEYEYETSIYSDSDLTITCTGPISTAGPYQFILTKL